MSSGEVETFYSNGHWHNRIEGTDFVFGTSATRGAAVWAGRTRARKGATAHVVRGVDGQIDQRHDYAEAAVSRGSSGRRADAELCTSGCRHHHRQPRAEVQRLREQYGDDLQAGLVRLLTAIDEN